MDKLKSQLGLVFGILAISLFAGCGDDSPPVGQVTGTLKLDGKPFDKGSLVFTPLAGGRPSVATTDADGNYVAYYLRGKKGVLLGKHSVAFDITSDEALTEEQQLVLPTSAKGGPKSYKVTPAEIDVVKGKNEIDFEVSSK